VLDVAAASSAGTPADDVLATPGLLLPLLDDEDFFHSELRLRHIGSLRRHGVEQEEYVFSAVETVGGGRGGVVRRRW